MIDNYDRIPDELRSQRRWIVWRREGEKKTPYQAVVSPGGFVRYKASNQDADDWRDFADAVDLVAKKKADGIGYALEEGYIFVDLDKCISDGEVEQWVQDTIDRLDSYTEISQSGTGVHVLIKGKKPTSRCCSGNIEIYDHSRFMYLTGDVVGDRETIEERDISWLCEEALGEPKDEVEPVEVGGLVLDPFREPPKDELAELLKDKRFKREWEHDNPEANDQSMSGYDYRLVLLAIEAGKDDQFLADLIIKHRKVRGDESDQRKALREDYVTRTIAEVRAETSSDAMLKLLPFKVVKVIQIGETDSQYDLVLEDGRKIRFESTAELRSARRADNKLYELDYHLSPIAIKRWRDITKALRKMAQVKPSISRDETTTAWLANYLRFHGPSINTIKGGWQEINESFSHGADSAVDDEGRIYVTVPSMTHHARIVLGWNKNTYGVAADLISLGFTKKQLDYVVNGKRHRPAVWVSMPGLFEEIMG